MRNLYDKRTAMRFLVVSVLWLVTLGLAACGRGGEDAAVTNADEFGSVERPNVLVICIDVLRADHLGAYGRPRPTTPWIDRLAKRSVAFDRVVSPASWTKPSVPSYFTGRFPHQHGVYEGSRSEAGRLVSDVLPEDETTFAEMFASSDYRTAAFVNNAQIDGVLGFSQGFEIYEDDCGDAVDIRSRFLEWLDEEFGDSGADDGDPFCAYLHFLDIHWPYTPEEPFRTMFRSSESSIDFFTPAWKTLKRNIREGVIEVTEADRRSMIDLYDAELRFTDVQIGRVVDGLRERGCLEDTIVVLLSDHGEEFMEHGGIGHGNGLFGELIDVPMLIRLPWERHAGVRVETAVSTVDLLPTLAELCDVVAPLGIAGTSLVSTIEVAAAGGSAADVRPRPIYSEGIHGDRYHQSIVYDGWKYIAEIYLGEIDDGGEDEPDVPDARDRLAPGLRVEIEGVLADTTGFLAEEVIVQDDQEDERDKITGIVESMEGDGSALTVLGFRVPLDEDTEVESDDDDEELDIEALAVGTYVKVYGRVEGRVVSEVDKIKVRGEGRRPKTKLEGAIRGMPRREGNVWIVRVADREVRIDGGAEVMTQAWERVLDERKNRDDSKVPAATATRDPLAMAREFGIPVEHSLYDLRSDPGESRDLASRNPDRVAELRSLLESLRVVSERTRSARALESSDEERLRALGYIK